MERVSKVLLILTIVAGVLALNVEGRMLKSEDEQVDHPQNFYGGAGATVFPGSGGPGYTTGIVFTPSGVCLLPGGCVPAAPVLPTIPGGSVGSGGTGSAPLVPHN